VLLTMVADVVAEPSAWPLRAFPLLCRCFASSPAGELRRQRPDTAPPWLAVSMSASYAAIAAAAIPRISAHLASSKNQDSLLKDGSPAGRRGRISARTRVTASFTLRLGLTDRPTRLTGWTSPRGNQNILHPATSAIGPSCRLAENCEIDCSM